MSSVAFSLVGVQLRPQDNVAIITQPVPADTSIDRAGQTLTTSRKIGMGHKMALMSIKKGDAVYKYGQIIGFASQDIGPGDWVHMHNVNADVFERDYAYCQDCPPPQVPPSEYRTWMGYDRGDGRYRSEERRVGKEC